MSALFFNSNLDFKSYIISIAKMVSDKNEAMIQSIKFFSSDIVLYITLFSYDPYKSTIKLQMKYYYYRGLCS